MRKHDIVISVCHCVIKWSDIHNYYHDDATTGLLFVDTVTMLKHMHQVFSVTHAHTHSDTPIDIRKGSTSLAVAKEICDVAKQRSDYFNSFSHY